jgi:hypothetical protein
LSPTPEVIQVLAKNHVRGCGEFYQKAGPSRGEFAIACTRDGRAWTGYLVFTGTEKVLGPDSTLIYDVGGPPRGSAVEEGNNAELDSQPRDSAGHAEAALKGADRAIARAQASPDDNSLEEAANALERAADATSDLANEIH